MTDKSADLDQLDPLTLIRKGREQAEPAFTTVDTNSDATTLIRAGRGDPRFVQAPPVATDTPDDDEEVTP